MPNVIVFPDELFDIALKMEIKYLKEKKDILITEKFDK